MNELLFSGANELQRSVELEDEIKKYNTIYNELCDSIGEANMLKVYQLYRGMQVSFPSKLYSRQYIENQIVERYDGNNIKELAREYGYTVKYFNQLVKELKTKK